MFQGETAVTLDDKGRVSIPATQRELVSRLSGNRLVVTYNPFEHGCLWLFPEKEWEQVRDEVNALSRAKTVHRNLQMKLVGAAAHVEPDGNGRVLLPASQRSARRRRSCSAWATSWSCGANRRTWQRSAKRSARSR